jgi:hypothetical protein
VTMPKTGAVSGRDGVPPSASGLAWRAPVTAGRKGQATGVRDQLAARSQDEGNWAEEVSVTGFSLFLSTVRHLSRACPAGLLRTGVAGQLPRGR